MKSLVAEAITDWANNRTRFIMETLAMLSVIIFVVVFAWTAGAPTVSTNIFLLSVDIFGGSCGITVGVMRKSINLFLLNAVLVTFCILGLLRIYYRA